MNSPSYRKFSLSIALAVFIFLLFFPDVAVELALEFFHTLFELLFGLFDVLFEIVETSLDHFIEHLFDTDLQETQTIVFYIMMALLIYIGYRVLRRLPSFYRRCKDNLINAGIKFKTDAILFWQNLSAVDKIKLIAAAVLALYLVFMSAF